MNTLLPQRIRAALRSSWIDRARGRGPCGVRRFRGRLDGVEPASSHGRYRHPARQPHRRRRRLRQLLRRRAVRHLAAARRRHRRGAAGDDAHRFRPADRALRPAGRRDSRARRHRRRQDPPRLRQRRGVRRIGRPSRPRQRRRSERRTARRHRARRSSSPRAITWSSRAVARRCSRSTSTSRRRTTSISTQSPPVVTARPYIVAEIEPVAEKELRLRGALVSTDVAGSSYTVDVRPWFRPDGAHGRVTVHTTSSTSFEIDGVPATGAAGLAALAAKPAGTMTVAFGTLSTQERRFTAEIVHAGDSVSGERVDAIHGNIVARRGDQLTVKGAFAVRRDHVARLHRTVIINVGPNTKVLKTGTPGARPRRERAVGRPTDRRVRHARRSRRRIRRRRRSTRRMAASACCRRSCTAPSTPSCPAS